MPEWKDSDWSAKCAERLKATGEMTLTEREALECLLLSGLKMDTPDDYKRLLNMAYEIDWEGGFALVPMQTNNGLIFAVAAPSGDILTNRPLGRSL